MINDISAGCLVFDKSNKVLLIKTSKGYEMPKGKREKDEKILDCAKRETEEETGINPIVTGYLGHYLSRKDRLVLFFLAQKKSGEIKPNEKEDIISVDWFSLDVAKKKIIPEQKHLIYLFSKKEDKYDKRKI